MWRGDIATCLLNQCARRPSSALQAGDTSAYALSIAAALRAWGPPLHAGLVEDAAPGAGADDAAFSHVCDKLAATFVPYLFHHGLMKCASRVIFMSVVKA